MFNHLVESNAYHSWHLGHTLWSAAAHGVLITAAAIATRPPPPDAPRPAPTREVIYFLPLLPKSAPMVDAGVRWASGSDAKSGLAPESKKGLLPAGGGERGRGKGRRGQAARPQPPKASEDAGGEGGGTVYVESELDRVVERDPASAAPVYPENLRRNGISGGATVEFVVDTTGHADTTSFTVVKSTHPEFVGAVRDALPLMLFRPAELRGRHVRQLVRQDFYFRIVLPDSLPPAPTDSAQGQPPTSRG